MVKKGLVIEADLYNDMLNMYKRADLECDYRPSKYLRMMNNKGALNTAKELLLELNDIYDLNVLIENERIDLSIEYLVLKDKYSDLFTEDEKNICRKRLEEHNTHVNTNFDKFKIKIQ